MLNFLRAVGRAVFSRAMLALIVMVLGGLALWFLGPLLSFGGLQPLESVAMRVTVIALLVALAFFVLLHWPVTIVGVVALSLLVWHAGPLFAVGNAHPLGSAGVRGVIIAAILLTYLSERKWADIEKMIRRAIADFEPRLLPGSVVVKPVRQGQGESTYNILQFEISAMLHMEPYPVEFTVQSAVDLETNRISILRS